MNVALYQPWIYLHGGLERSLLELVTRSRHQWHIFTSHYEPENTFDRFRSLKVTELRRVSVERGMVSVLRAACRIAGQRLPLDGCDALVVWCDGLGDLVTLRNHDLPTFNICSTPLRAAFDPVYEQAVRSRSGLVGRAAYSVFKWAFRLVDRRAWRHYDGVIATSREVRNRIVAGGLYREGPRMRTFFPGIDWAAFGGDVTYEPLLLVPGRIMWTKNIELAIEAFKLAAMPPPWRLVIAGFVDHKSGDYLRRLRQLADGEDRVEFVASPSDEHLDALYRRASAILFPPPNEDWGIVPLEAMARSKPVVANASGGPLESVPDGQAGWLLANHPEAWASVLSRLPNQAETIREMGRRARQHVRKYDWSEFVSGVDTAIEDWIALG